MARDAAHAAGRSTLESFGRRVQPEIKPDGSPVTAVDKGAESELRRIIQESFPTHTIVGEEGGTSPGDPRVRWILDPIDGTKAFIHGVPLYSVLVAVEVEGRPSVGVIHLPALEETVEAATGMGCRWNGKVSQVSSTESLSESTIITTSVRALEARGVPFHRLASATRTQRGWGDAYGFALVATGRAEAAIEPKVGLWDVAPMLPIIEEAGGIATDWSGARTILSSDFVASNGAIHAQLLRLLTNI